MSKKHARFGSPSGLSALEKCPGKIAYTKDMPELPESEYAKEGTEFHRVMEAHAPLVLGLSKEVQATQSPYPDMSDYVSSSISELDKLYASFEAKHEHTSYYVEQRVPIYSGTEQKEFGTADIIFSGYNTKSKLIDVVCLDWKFGAGVKVIAEENIQGIAYALGAVRNLKLKSEDIGTCVVIIAQVRLEDGWSRFNFKGTEIEKYETKIKKIVDKAVAVYEGKEEVLPNLHAGSHCRFCKANGICVAQKKDLVDPLDIAKELPVEEAVNKLTMEEQVWIFMKKKHIESFLDAVATNLARSFAAGVTHPYLKLVKTKGRRKWKDEDETVEYLQEAGIKQPYTKKVIGITEAEKILGKGVVDHLTEIGEGKIELVRGDDKRPSVGFNEAKELPIE